MEATHLQAPAALRELLLARADELGITGDGGDDAVIEDLLCREVRVPEAEEAACRRHYDADPARWRTGAMVEAAHILVGVRAGADVAPLAAQAQRTLAVVRDDPSQFERCARDFSNCPSGRIGGSLGQLRRGECVPEFDAALFDAPRTGLLPEVVRTRHGFHVVRIARREPGCALPFEAVREAIAVSLTARAWQAAARQYVEWLQRRAAGGGEAVSPLLR